MSPVPGRFELSKGILGEGRRKPQARKLPRSGARSGARPDEKVPPEPRDHVGGAARGDRGLQGQEEVGPELLLATDNMHHAHCVSLLLLLLNS